VDDGNRRVRRFFEAHKHLYADLADIRDVHDRLLARYDGEVGQATGMDLGLDDEEPPELDPEELEARFRKKAEQAERVSPGTDGYYIGEDGKLAAVLVRTPFGTGDQRAFELRARVERIIEELRPTGFHPSLRFGFTGNLITSAEAQRAITSDLAHVGVWGVGLILAVVFLFFLKVRTLLAMMLTIGTGCCWAFGLAHFTVGYLNTATGFLVSIIAGNGINFGIIYMARYIEERRDRALSVPESIEAAHRGTYGATLAAAGAAMIAYGSLSLTDFRGFKHFGIIGGAGMLL
jgi:predicted RND superfamily exporter protein